MPVAYKVLGQSAPAATTNTTAYTVPSATGTVVSSITVCNRGTSDGFYRVAIRPDNATLANQHYVFYDVQLPAGATDVLTMGMTLDAADVVTVYASTANFSFNLFGTEIT